MAEEKNKVLQKARIEMNYLTGDEAVRRLAELREKWEMDRISAISYAEEKGRKLGEAEGRKLGETEGRNVGIIEGAKRKTEEIAKEMIKQGLPIEVIISVTKLSKEEIEKLK